jgi:hypothetical protein
MGPVCCIEVLREGGPPVLEMCGEAVGSRAGMLRCTQACDRFFSSLPQAMVIKMMMTARTLCVSLPACYHAEGSGSCLTIDCRRFKLQALLFLRLECKSLVGFESSVVCEGSGQRFLRAKEAVLGFV